MLISSRGLGGAEAPSVEGGITLISKKKIDTGLDFDGKNGSDTLYHLYFYLNSQLSFLYIVFIIIYIYCYYYFGTWIEWIERHIVFDMSFRLHTNCNLACKLLIYTRCIFHFWYGYSLGQALSGNIYLDPVALSEVTDQ